MDILLLVITIITIFYVAWSIGANDETMAVVAGSGFTSLAGAVAIAAIMDFLGALIFGYKVEETLGKHLLNFELTLIDTFILSISIATWLILASVKGWPVSTTHSAVGAAIGLGLVRMGLNSINWYSLTNVVFGWVFSPVAGLIGAYIIIKLFDIFIKPRNMHMGLKISRIASLILLIWSAYTSFFRGANDVANATAFLVAIYPHPEVVRFVGGLGMALGVYILGRRVVKNVGLELVEMSPITGLAVQVSVALTISIGTMLGLPLSGTHVLVAAVAGLGIAKKYWLNIKGLKEILMTWVVTFPGAAIMAILLGIFIR